VGTLVQLSARALNMTQDSYGQAYRQGFIRTVRLLRSRGATMDNAEDAAQAAWLQGWQKLDQLRDERMILSWVNTIALNWHRHSMRREARYQVLPDLCGHAGIDLAPIDAAKILRICRPADRILFEHQLGGLTTNEIAEKHRVSTTAIRIRLLRARRAVRAHVEDRAAGLRESMRMQGCAAAAG
jgi:DNA-directed RNA polymerase specialized sigma24 family protein